MIKQLIEYYKKRKNPIKYWRNKGVTIGEDCCIFSSAHLGGEPYLVKIGNHVRINGNCQFITHDGGAWVLREMYPDLSDVDLFGKITIGNNVQFGNNVIVMPRVTIGDNCIIGAGAIVTKDIPSNSIAVGVPAKVIETIEEYKEKNTERFFHTKGMTYKEKKDWLYKNFL